MSQHFRIPFAVTGVGTIPTFGQTFYMISVQISRLKKAESNLLYEGLSPHSIETGSHSVKQTITIPPATDIRGML